eukprot:2526118-Amphidinium_carterae.1
MLNLPRERVERSDMQCMPICLRSEYGLRLLFHRYLCVRAFHWRQDATLVMQLLRDFFAGRLWDAEDDA